jgi:hypothetical protein
MLDLVDIHHLMSSLPEQGELGNKKDHCIEYQPVSILFLLFKREAKTYLLVGTTGPLFQ